MTKRRKWTLLWTGIAVVLIVIGLRAYYVAFLRGPKIIRRWVQPDDVHYDEHDPYAVALVFRGYEFINGISSRGDRGGAEIAEG